MAHAYFIAAGNEQGIAGALEFTATSLGIGEHDPDLAVLRYGLFSVDDARRLIELSLGAPVAGERRAVIVSVGRFFHEAQNALLKLFEEPPAHVTIVLVVPSAGILLPTLRSRLMPLPAASSTGTISPIGEAFLAGGPAEREKLISKLVERTKSDKEDEKQAARTEAVLLLEDLIRAGNEGMREAEDEDSRREARLFLDDALGFLPLLHTRSAPLKLILEHLRLVIPKSLTRAPV